MIAAMSVMIIIIPNVATNIQIILQMTVEKSFINFRHPRIVRTRSDESFPACSGMGFPVPLSPYPILPNSGNPIKRVLFLMGGMTSGVRMVLSHRVSNGVGAIRFELRFAIENAVGIRQR
jgi:hypothetical protein